jgi:SAM-dependent methyltransferase
MWHDSDDPIDDRALDASIGIQAEEVERNLSLFVMLRRYGNELVNYEGVPYSALRELYRRIKLEPRDLFYDLGAGYGRALFYGALVGEGTFRGIELVAERAAEMRRVRDSLGLVDMEILQGDVQTVDFSDATVIFVFNSFFRPTLEIVGRRLQELSRARKIRIGSMAQSNDYFETQPWLREVGPKSLTASRYALRLFVSQ